MIYFPDYQKASTSLKLDLIEDYLKQQAELAFVQFSSTTKLLLTWIMYYSRVSVEPLSKELERRIFTSDKNSPQVTAILRTDKNKYATNKLAIVSPLAGMALSVSGLVLFEHSTRLTVAAIIAALLPMKYRLDRDDISEHAVDNEVDEIYTLLKLHAYLTVDGLTSVAKAVFYHYQVLPELGANRGAVQRRVCDSRLTIDAVSNEIETLAARYDQLPPRIEEGFS
jgi:hypothetical protein